MSLFALWFHYVSLSFIGRENEDLSLLKSVIRHFEYSNPAYNIVFNVITLSNIKTHQKEPNNNNPHIFICFGGRRIVTYNLLNEVYVLNICVNILCLGSRGTRGSQIDSHSSNSNYHDSWETRSSYPERDRYPERDNREQARDSSFERRHGERDRRDNRERGLLTEILLNSHQQWLGEL